VGGVLDGYAADLTRTIALGEPGDEARGAYEVVRRAQQAGKNAVRGGVSGRDADAAARAVIDEAGLGHHFTHGLGHGVGLETHEWPRLSKHADDIIPRNAVVTVEPGVYLPGRFGVRIEDVVVATAGGAETLTPLGTDLIVL
jgi:Xaa-Pro aminopeptidase